MRSETIYNQQSQVFFTHEECEIRNPFISECGRFTADPRAYGFREVSLGSGSSALVLELDQGGQIRLADPSGNGLPSTQQTDDNLIARFSLSGHKVAEFKIGQIVDAMGEHSIQARLVSSFGEFECNVDIETGEVSTYEKLSSEFCPDFVSHNRSEYPVMQGMNGGHAINDLPALIADYEALHLAAPAPGIPSSLYRVLTEHGELCEGHNDLSLAQSAKWSLLSIGHLATIADTNNSLVPETDPLLVQKEAFCKLLADLRTKGQLFHLDDNPDEVINVYTGQPLFTDQEADRLGLAIEGFRKVLGNEQMWEAAWPFLNEETADQEDEDHSPNKRVDGPRMG